MFINTPSKSEKTAMRSAFEQVFGNVNGSADKRVALGERGYTEMRCGKTKRDKANGHDASRKNVRIWDGGNGKGAKGGTTGSWVKR